MSTSAIPAAASAALSATTFPLHGLGHKRGLKSDALTDPSSSASAQTPTGSTQNLFSSLLTSLEQTIGLQHPQVGQTPATAQAQSSPSTPAALPSIGSKINVSA
jgi:hypothetical protein